MDTNEAGYLRKGRTKILCNLKSQTVFKGDICIVWFQQKAGDNEGLLWIVLQSSYQLPLLVSGSPGLMQIVPLTFLRNYLRKKDRSGSRVG